MKKKILFLVLILILVTSVQAAYNKHFYIDFKNYDHTFYADDDILHIEVGDLNERNYYLYDEPVTVKFMVDNRGQEERLFDYRAWNAYWNLVDSYTETVPADKWHVIEVTIDDPGYYFVRGILKDKDTYEKLNIKTVSVGIFSKGPDDFYDEHKDMPFGLWTTRAQETFPILGVKWSRIKYSWTWQDYKEDSLEFLKDNNIGVIMYFMPDDTPSLRSAESDLLPKDWEQYEINVTEKVIQWKDHVDIWAGWNEPFPIKNVDDDDIIRYWSMMNDIIDEHDPGSLLIGPCVNTMNQNNKELFIRVFDKGLANYIDGIELHPYTHPYKLPPREGTYIWQYPDEAPFIENTTYAKQLAVARGMSDDAPIVFSEFGGIYAHGETMAFQEVYQAQYLVRSFMEVFRADIDVAIWHNSAKLIEFEEEPGGGTTILRKSETKSFYQPKPAAVAYGVMTRQLMGADFVGMEDNSNHKVYKFDNDVEVIWGTDDIPVSINRDVGSSAVKIVDLFGNYTIKKTNNGVINLVVGDSPLYIKPALLGDLNEDNKIDIKDILILVKEYGKNSQHDMNGDNIVSLRDIVVLAKEMV